MICKLAHYKGLHSNRSQRNRGTNKMVEYSPVAGLKKEDKVSE